MLDTMELEQERGITIKLTPVRMQRKWVDLNLIDTPWHVDFQYEVSRSLAAVEWCILVVDASQWIQAQTLSTLYMAMENDLTIIPVLNKIDLPAADPERRAMELQNLLWVDTDEIIWVSAKTWENVEAVLDAVIERIEDPLTFKNTYPDRYRVPQADVRELPWGARALIFDSVFDPYRGVVTYIKVVNGTIKPNTEFNLIYSEVGIRPPEVGHFAPKYIKDTQLEEWQIGYLVTWQKSVRDAKIGDTIIQGAFDHKAIREERKKRSLPWFKPVTPYVFAWVYPIDTDDYERLKTAFEKLSLNDSALAREYEQSVAMGHGFRCGFLGTLHMDIIKERLSREYGMETLFTIPTVLYMTKLKYLKHPSIVAETNIKDLVQTGLYKDLAKYLGESLANNDDKLNDQQRMDLYTRLRPWLVVRSWWDMPEQWDIEEILEPLNIVEIVWPDEYSGNIMGLAQEYRGELKWMDYLDDQRVVRKYIMPMGEIIIDFYDKLKSLTRWYGTMNYEMKWYTPNALVRLDIFVNSERVEAFSMIVHKDKAYQAWKDIVGKLKTLIPKHLFAIPLQAGIGVKMIARETISAIRKDVTAKCYGWDISRKKKLLKNQKEWKKRMKQMGRVSVPGDVFIKLVGR